MGHGAKEVENVKGGWGKPSTCWLAATNSSSSCRDVADSAGVWVKTMTARSSLG